MRTGFWMSLGLAIGAASVWNAQSARAQSVRTDTVVRDPVDPVDAGELARRVLLDPEPDSRGALFERVWEYEDNGGTQLWRAASDVEGNIILAGTVATPAQTASVQKLDGAQNAFPSILWTVDVPFLSVPRACDVDLDGNIYIAGFGPVTPGSQTARVAKISPQGFILWQRSYLSPDSLVTCRDIAVDADGVPFVMVDAEQGQIAIRLDPLTGNLAWSTNLNSASDCVSGFTSGAGAKIAIDRAGRVNVAIPSAEVGERAFVVQVDGATGEVQWCNEVFKQIDFLGDGSIDTDIDGNILLCGWIGLNGAVTKFSPQGEVIWQRSIGSGGIPEIRWNVVRAASDSSVIVGGSWFDANASAGDAGIVLKYTAGGGLEWYTFIGDGAAHNTPTTLRDGVEQLELDRFDNAYAGSVHRFAIGPVEFRNSSVAKFARDDGAIIWSEFDALDNGYASIDPNDLVVDRGANVFLVSTAQGGPFSLGRQVLKYTQPFVDAPTIQTACAELAFENRSIWAPGTGHLIAEQDLFSISWNEGVDEEVGFTIPLAGEFGGGFSFLTDGTLDAGVRAEINGGSADVHLPLDIEFTFPSANKLGPGSEVTVEVEWTPDPAARLTSCFTPTFNAGFTAGVDYSVFSDAYLRAFSEDLFDTTFVDVERSLPVDYVPGMNLLDILALAGAPTPGEWSTIELPPKGLFTAEFRTPQMFAQGRYDPLTQSFSTDTTDRFFSFDLSVTEAILRSVGATANFEFEFPSAGGDGGNDNNGGDEEEEPSSDFGIAGDGQVLQLLVGVEMGARQQIDVGVVPMIRYEFSDGIPTQTIPITQDLVFTLPSKPFDGQVEIRPTLVSSADFMNATDIQVFPGLGWITLEASLTAFAFGFDVLPLGPYCFGCFDWDLSEILQALGIPNPDAVNLALNVFDGFWQIPFDEVPLPCMRVLASTTNRPDLVAASRESMGMLIYDQTSPSQASFNVTTGGTTKMLLYGVRMTPDSQAFIEHWGREEAIPTTHINDSTLLIEVPDRFRLLPGVAKLYVVASGLASDSIDIPVTYPRPRLDAVNPNLWAADPDLAALPIAVIDGRSFVGNDTFIARRDYYIKLRDDLWSDATDAGFPGGAAAYFPQFDFNQMPGFPAVLWGGASSGKPLPRFVQPVDNGIHNVRLGEDQYDRPQIVPVVICNPGPGGGVSNELELTIAAPRPVATTIEPNGMSPEDVVFDDDYFDPGDTPTPRPVELRVMGPAHVPNFQGYEEPKYGNFNADSIVRFNGVDLPTTFVSSFLLEADLPPEMVTLGDHAITVFTPSNGTSYFEELRVDADGDGLPDPEPVLQELVESGGESAPLLFRIRYREPVIDSVSPNLVEVGSIAFDDSMLPKSQPYNMTLLGEDFRDGAVVTINGEERSTMSVGPTMLRVKLLPEDVSEVGTYPIRVRNPGPDYQVSEPRLFKVDFPSRSLRAGSIGGSDGAGRHSSGRVAGP